MEAAVVENFGGKGLPLLFAHANGYPPGSYRELFAHLEDRFAINALEHRPLWGGREPPRRLSWQLFASDMLDAIDRHYDEPVWVMGHSMGGTIAALAAQRHPDKIAGLILLDPVFLPDRFVLATRLMPEKRRQKMPMLRRALSRPEHFENHAKAFEFYRGKRAFKGLSDEALTHYVKASKAPLADGGVQLRYSGAWEAAVYGSAPRARPLMKRMLVPTLALRGENSDTLRPEIWSRWQHWQPAASFREIPGGHLFPLEAPLATAKAVSDYIFGD
ncbi:alpha/beta fold hydrolase [Congregibacter litoralis]|uniref:Putative hydrolase or acyltransferase (Alpha/beta hydrolase superfamily) n=1 Tax=Congregibacter litoralis KT71 TaxID=314285 RepID=A4A3Q6_9GAMM|nr:alpha/beta hydrolase [Congregibacter litoralis]EAQ99329.1 putative hydrolase or acyltransferase (alpha/beta hydrolase superfamily) [Congregibacter litoralis KT71]